jgi:hypothetical protein
MTETDFWSHIESCRIKATDNSPMHKLLEDDLAQLSLGEILSFKKWLLITDQAANRFDIWAVVYIICGGCSDDGFMDFRSWLISKGRKFYNQCLITPEVIDDDCDSTIFYEQMAYVANKAYVQKSGTRIPEVDFKYNPEPAGKEWIEKDLPFLYPRLWKKYSDKFSK